MRTPNRVAAHDLGPFSWTGNQNNGLSWRGGTFSRVLQVAGDEVVIDYACMARKAGIWVMLLIYRHLQNTLTKIFPEVQSKHSSTRIRLCTKPADMTRKQEARLALR